VGNVNIITPNYKTEGKLIYNNKPDKLILHHGDAVHASAEDINIMHLNRGFTMIGYNYYVRKDGSIYKGRPETARGANCQGQNTSSISICAEGAYHDKDTLMSESQKNSIIELGRDILRRNLNIKRVDGHNAFDATACPGKYYPLDEIRASILRPAKKLAELIVTMISPCLDADFNVLKYFQPGDAITAVGTKGQCWIVSIDNRDYFVPAGYSKMK
jgi:hypothetical protein